MANINKTTLDSNGNNRVLSDDVRDIQFVDLTSTTFYSPDSIYTGYAASGQYYVNGVPENASSSGHPGTASWASESFATNIKGDSNRFPDRILILTTAHGEICILDADSLTLWMRIGQGAGSSIIDAGDKSTWTSYQSSFRGVMHFSNGILIFKNATPASAGLYIFNFRDDVIVYSNDTVTYYKNGISNRMTVDPLNASTWETSSSVHASASTGKLLISFILDLHSASPGSRSLAALGHETGFTGINLRSKTNTSGGITTTLPEFRISRNTISQSHALTFSSDTITLFDRFYLTEDPSGTPWNWIDGTNGPTLPTSNNGKIRKGDLVVIGSKRFYVLEPGDGATGNLLFARDSMSSSDVTTLTALSAYTVSRPIPLIRVLDSGDLIFLDGTSSLRKLGDEWWNSSSTVVHFTDYGVAIPPSGNVYDTNMIKDIAVDGDNVYLAITGESGSAGISYPKALHVFHSSIPSTTADLTTNSFSSKFSSITLGVNNPGDIEIHCISLDPESGHLFTSITRSGTEHGILEVDPSTDLVVKSGLSLASGADIDSSYTSTSPVHCIAGLRNPSGPPEVEVT